MKNDKKFAYEMFAGLIEVPKKIEVKCICTGCGNEHEVLEDGSTYDPLGQLDRTAADYADGLPDATSEEDEQITDRD